MSAIQAFILGIVQGACEFLPVSSSGHLVLLQRIFGINEGALSFDIVLHFATLISLCFVMRKRLLEYLREPLGRIPKMIVLGTIPTAIIALVFSSVFSDLFDSGVSLGFGFLFTAAILYFAERHSAERHSAERHSAEWEAAGRIVAGSSFTDRYVGGGSFTDRYVGSRRAADGVVKKSEIEKRVSPKGALIVGIAQGIAITPAVSRSGSTIAAGIMCDFGRPAAIEFAFLMSIPVTLLAVAQDALKILMHKGEAAAAGAVNAGAANAAAAGAAASTGVLEMAIGFVAALIVGYFAARFMLVAIRRIKLTWFSLYAGALGVLVLVDQLFVGAIFDKFF